MTYSFDGDSYLLVFKKGEEVLTGLKEFAAQTNSKTAWISGFGGALGVELGYYNLTKKEYQWRAFDQLSEIVSLTGNISRDTKGEPAFHLHGVFADETYSTIGGHVRKLIVGGTVEMIIREFSQPSTREFDEVTGLKLLDI